MCIEFEANVPFTTIDADYVMDGKFLVLPLNGKGKCNMTLSKFNYLDRRHSVLFQFLQ
jgi:hypothetical protein